jgi:MFS family permease
VPTSADPVPPVRVRPPAAARRARGAVAALFFANGAIFANVVPRYPDIKAGLALSNTALGSAVAAYGLGALAAGFVGGLLVSRFGSRRVAVCSTAVLAANLVLVGAAPSWWMLAVALFVAGTCDSIGDLAVNAHGLRVERLYGRSILNAFHGLWSVGAVVGGVMGAAAAGLRIPPHWHLPAVAVLFAALAVTLLRLLLPGGDDAGRPASPAGPAGRRHLRLAWRIGALGLIGASAQQIEDVCATWSPVYLREDLGAAAGVAGFGFVALQASQTVGRLLGDRVVTRYGDRAVARAGALLAGLAVAAALAVPSPALTVAAFGVAGLGIGTLIPASLRMVDAIPGLSPGMGLTLVGLVNRAGILVMPPIIGAVADAAGLRVALGAVPLAAAVVVLLTPVLSAVDRRPGNS